MGNLGIWLDLGTDTRFGIWIWGFGDGYKMVWGQM